MFVFLFVTFVSACGRTTSIPFSPLPAAAIPRSGSLTAVGLRCGRATGTLQGSSGTRPGAPDGLSAPQLHYSSPLCPGASLRGNVAGHGRGTFGITSAADVFGRAQYAARGFGPPDPSPFVAHMSYDGGNRNSVKPQRKSQHQNIKLENLVIVIKSTE